MEGLRLSGRSAVLIFAAPRAVESRSRGLEGPAEHLLTLPIDLTDGCDADVHVFSTDITAIAAEVRRQLPVSRLHVQHGGSFASRLTNAAARLVALGYDRIIIIGRDCPQLSVGDCRQALRLMASHRMVIGPNARGGCYLIGIRASDVSMLAGVEWCAGVDAQQLRRLADRDVADLRPLRDLHSVADLRAVLAVSKRCRRVLQPRPALRRTARAERPSRRRRPTMRDPARAPPIGAT